MAIPGCSSSGGQGSGRSKRTVLYTEYDDKRVGREGADEVARAIGVMHMEDQGEGDDKVIAVHINDPAVAHYKDIDELPPHTMREIMRFFQDYKILERKEVKVDKPDGHEKALEVVCESFAAYRAEESRLRGW